jgi:hypothetical protein
MRKTIIACITVLAIFAFTGAALAITVPVTKADLKKAISIIGKSVKIKSGITTLPDSSWASTVTKFYDKRNSVVGKHVVNDSIDMDIWYSVNKKTLSFVVAARTIDQSEKKQAAAILGNVFSSGIKLLPDTNKKKDSDDTLFYDSSGNLVGTHIVSSKKDSWYMINSKGKSVLYAEGASADYVKKGREIIGLDVSSGVTILASTKGGTAVTKFFDATGNLLGKRVVTPSTGEDAWYGVNINGSFVFIREAATIDEVKQSTAILGAGVSSGVKTPVNPANDDGSTITKFYDKNGKLLGTHVITASTGADNWYSINSKNQSVLIAQVAAANDMKRATAVFGSTVSSGIKMVPSSGVSTTKIFNTDGVLIGQRVVTSSTNTENWYTIDKKGKSTLVAQGATQGEINTAVAYLGSAVTNGIKILPASKKSPTTTKFFDNGGNLIGEHVVTTKSDSWYSINKKGKSTLVTKPKGDAEVAQRKAVEAQIELKGNGTNYTSSSQMASTSKELVQVQKK